MREKISRNIEHLYTMKPKQLMVEYQRLTGETYYTHNRKSLIRKIAWLYQIKDVKPISQLALERMDELIQDTKLRIYPPTDFKVVIPKQPINSLLNPGTVISKNYHGKHHEVVVLDKGFMWNNMIYKSISGVAKAITGSHWNGKLFFGVK